MEAIQKSSGRKPVFVIAAGLLVLVGSGLLVQDPPAAWEASLFHFFNDLPHNVEPGLWVLQQMGSAIVLPFAAIVLWRVARRWQPPVALVATGFLLGWLGAKVIKAMVGRGRPGAILDDVVLGFDVPITEVGFPSGHAVLVFTLVVASAPYLGRRGLITATSVAIAVAITRIYVGAHLPLDVIGGAGYGLAIGSIVTLIAGPGEARNDSVVPTTVGGG